jgi:hypothetical protein
MPSDISKRVAQLQPNSYLPEDPLNVSLLRSMVESNRYEMRSWQRSDTSLKKVRIENGTGVPRCWLAGTDAIVFESPCNPLDVDFLEIECEPAEAASKPRHIKISWGSGTNQFASQQLVPGQKTYRFLLSERRDWILSQPVSTVRVSIHGAPELPLRAVRAGSFEAPSLSWSGDTLVLKPDSFLSPRTKDLMLLVDATNVNGAAGTVLEISQPNHFFLHYTRQIHDAHFSGRELKRVSAPLNGPILLKRSEFERPGLYQVRVAAVDSYGTMVGTMSDPLTLDLRDYSFE